MTFCPRPCAHTPIFAGFAGAAASGAKAGTVAGTEGLTGVARKEEAFEAAFPGAGDYFDRAGVGAFEEGTRENPIPILSTEAERCVGISLPVSSTIR